MNEEKCTYPQTWRCPICGVPLSVGEKCEDGTKIESVPLKDLPEYFHNFNWEMFSLELLEVAPEWGEIDEQRAIFLIVPPVEKQNKSSWINIFAPKGVGVDTIDWVIYHLIEEYKFRRDCGLVDELKEKYSDTVKKWNNTRVRITPNQRRYVHLAAEYWGMDMRMAASLFLAYILYDERFQPDNGWWENADMGGE